MSIQSGNLKEFALEEIDIGRRQRRDMGDIHRLAASIEEASGNLPEGGEAMEQIAKLLGLSRRTLEKATKVVVAARQDNERYGDLVQKMDRTGKVNGAYMQMLQRQGEAPGRAAPAYLSIRMDRGGNCKITGLQDKVEIIANPKALIRQIEDELSETR
jgi:hypothetical protein